MSARAASIVVNAIAPVIARTVSNLSILNPCVDRAFNGNAFALQNERASDITSAASPRSSRRLVST